MKKKLAMMAVALALMLSLCGCTSNTSDESLPVIKRIAIISLPNGEFVEGEVEHYTYGSTSGISTVIVDGVKYQTHAVNIVIITEEEPK